MSFNSYRGFAVSVNWPVVGFALIRFQHCFNELLLSELEGSPLNVVMDFAWKKVIPFVPTPRRPQPR